MTTLRYMADEYEANAQGKSPDKRCPALIRFVVTDKCIGCTLCAQNCPVEAIRPTPYERHRIDSTKCVRCGVCRAVCPQKAIEAET